LKRRDFHLAVGAIAMTGHQDISKVTSVVVSRMDLSVTVMEDGKVVAKGMERNGA
jgi:hypothetical protein